MRFIRTSKEMRLTDLIAQAYNVEGKGATPTRKHAEAALRQANPQLAELERVPQNAVVFVPEVPGLDRTDASVSVATPAVELFDHLERLLEDGRKQLMEAIQQASNEASSTLALINKREFSNAVKRAKLAELKTLVDEAKKNVPTQVKQFKDTAKSIDRAILTLRTDLKSMKARHS